jgi:Flp pilus assembly protein TadG
MLGGFGGPHMHARCLYADERGSVVPVFALCIGVIFAAVGAAVDYSRAAAVRSQMQAAIDAAAIMLAKEAAGLTAAQLNDKAQIYFQANFKDPQGKTMTAVTSYSNEAGGTNKIKLVATGAIDTTIFRIFGTTQMALRTSTEVVWGMRRLELALALDNTGSMLQSGKLAALQSAAHNLIDTLKNTSKKKDDIRVAIVPFTTFVNVDPKKNKKAPWIDFSGWSEFESIGTEGGLSTDWVNAKTGKKWTGCVTDRNQPYDTQDTAPVGLDTLFPAVECVNPVPLQPLTSDWKRLHGKIDEMRGDGTTNVSIGVAWAWHALSTGEPLKEGSAVAKDLDKVIILLTDGDNTENRWGASTPAIDRRTEAACANVKKDGIKLYTVRVIAGNQSLLRNCASAPNMYFEVSQASQLNAVFKSISDSLATLHISK